MCACTHRSPIPAVDQPLQSSNPSAEQNPTKDGFVSPFFGEGMLWFLFFQRKWEKIQMFKNLTIHLVETTSVDKLWRWKSKLPHLFLLAIESLIPCGGCIYFDPANSREWMFYRKIPHPTKVIQTWLIPSSHSNVKNLQIYMWKKKENNR